MLRLIALTMLFGCGQSVTGQEGVDGPDQVRDPQSGACISAQSASMEELAKLAGCPSACQALDKAECAASPACRSAYVVLEDCPDCDPVFYTCWGAADAAESGGEACDGLAAVACSLRSDCVSVHRTRLLANDDVMRRTIGAFSSCISGDTEPPPVPCGADSSCDPGFNCTIGTTCVVPPECNDEATAADAGVDCSVCYGFCVQV